MTDWLIKGEYVSYEWNLYQIDKETWNGYCAIIRVWYKEEVIEADIENLLYWGKQPIFKVVCTETEDWTIWKFVCPECWKTNTHWFGLKIEPEDDELIVGHRISHCRCWDGYGIFI